ncbi:LmbE family N-acetylglucosaminyl deacetylase [Metabacillus crassostreae]|uniref:PIG-L family deacetylase n=1 Tax=Metabacillus crassostreae TaxID=929098 RepID=UPI00195ABC67|nr:PIG-L family deacetylase [Metabacillus crassostreae]MBM7606374.1 LmbE family N-acetylglucosaminyl deacetylase [Metabacillus crassostreae]
MRNYVIILSFLFFIILSSCGIGEKQQTSIFYAPHADDEVLSLGASILHHRNIGDKVVVVLLSEGKESNAFDAVNQKLTQSGYAKITKDEFASSRIKEFKRSVEALGVKKDDIYLYELPDGNIDEKDVKKIMIDLNDKYQNVTHHAMSYLDPHRDHAKSGVALKELIEEDGVKGTFYLPIQEHETIMSKGEYNVPKKYSDDFNKSLSAYNIWNPKKELYGIGYISVQPYFEKAKESMKSKWHD